MNIPVDVWEHILDMGAPLVLTLMVRLDPRPHAARRIQRYWKHRPMSLARTRWYNKRPVYARLPWEAWRRGTLLQFTRVDWCVQYNGKLRYIFLPHATLELRARHDE